MRRKGFTLMELLIVIAIIGLIAAIAAPRMEGTISDARGALFQSHIAAIATACEQWRAGHGGWLEQPASGTFTGPSNVPATGTFTFDLLVQHHYLQEEVKYYKEDDGGRGQFKVYVVKTNPQTTAGSTVTIVATGTGGTAPENEALLQNKTFVITATADNTTPTEKVVYIDDEKGLNIAPAVSTWFVMKSL